MKEVGLQYISQGNTTEEHIQNIQKVCKAGVRWVQLRLKDTDMATYLHAAIEVRNICDQFGAIMIVNDNIDVAKIAMADGVHLGLNDANPKEARVALGDNFIIGGTANTIKDCLQHINDGVDYIGLGPFRHTTTKKKLSPVLELEGYHKIISELRIQNNEVPVVGIGGITEQDIPQIMETGIFGIAVSGMLTNKEDLKEKIKSIKTLIAKKQTIKKNG